MGRVLLTAHLLSAILGLLLWSKIAFSQPSYSFRHYTTDQGLSNDQTTCIFKDQQGFMWFGTVNGLNRFDGIEFTVFKRTKNGLPGNYIIGINQSPDGWLWISTHRGICRYNPATETFEQIPLATQTDERGDNDFVSGIVFDKQGYGWFGSVDKLYRIHLQTLKITAYPGIMPIAHPILMYVFTDSKEQVWAQRAGALYQFNQEKGGYTYFMGRDSQHPDGQLHVVTLYEDSKQTLWATTYEKGLMRYDSRQQCFVDEPDRDSFISSLVEDWTPQGKPFFWMGKQANVSAYYPDSHLSVDHSHDIKDQLSHNGGDVVALFRDKQTGIIWIATSRGIEKVDHYEMKFNRTLLPAHAALNQPNEVIAIRQDIQDRALYWIGVAENGLFQWNRQTNTYTAVSVKQGLSTEEIYDFRQDVQGNLWIATVNGLTCWNPGQKQWKSFFPVKGSNQTIFSVFADKAGRIWAGSGQEGIFVKDPGQEQFRPWPLEEPVTDGNPLRIHNFDEDANGGIWVLTSQGIFRIQSLENITQKISLQALNKDIQPSERLQSTIKIDAKNHLWVSGIGFLAKADLNGKVLNTYTSENGLLADHIFSMEEDNSGNLWLVTDYLLHRLNPQTGEFTYFRKENGLYANSTTNQVTKDTQGQLFVGFTGAFNHFAPEGLVYNQSPPQVRITEVKIDNKKWLITPDQPVPVDPSQNTLSIDFAALTYTLPERNQYAYKMEGFDDQWTYTGVRSATYTNLPPGTYSFKVKAANSDGIWNEQGAALLIRKIPHFYQTWWFGLLLLSLAAGVIYAVYKYQEANRLHLEAIRNRIATDLHDDMGSTLSSIRIFSDVVQSQIAPVQPEVIPILQRISSSATGLSESMQDIIWTIQTRHDSLQDVVTRMREFGLKMAEAKGIDFRMQVSEKFHTTKFHVEQRRNVYLIFKESINNAVKYAECTRLNVDIEITGKILKLTIQDNGKGFDPATIRQGNGLQNLQKRASEIKGQLAIHSAPGAGTRIELHMRLTS